MGAWWTSINQNDAFADIYSEFYEIYNKGVDPNVFSEKIIQSNWEILEIEEEKNNLWFALALAQWETKSLDPEILSKVEDIISTGLDLEIWKICGADTKSIKKREIVLQKFLEKLKSFKLKAKSRKRIRVKTPIFENGSCLVLQFPSGNYGGAVVISSDTDPETGYNLLATTKLNQKTKPTLQDFENTEVLLLNTEWRQDRPDVVWRSPDLFYKRFSDIYENIWKITVDLEYDRGNCEGKGYLFRPFYTVGWDLRHIAKNYFESETTKPKPKTVLTIKQLTKKKKWWKLF